MVRARLRAIRRAVSRVRSYLYSSARQVWKLLVASGARARRHKAVSIIIIILAVVGFFSITPWLMGDLVRSECAIFWMKVLAGNWSPENPPECATEYLRKLAAIIAIMWNNSIVLIMIGLLWASLTKRRKAIMLLKHAFALKEVAIKQALYDAFPDRPEIVETIDKAFDKGYGDWINKYLKRYGTTQTQEVLNYIEKSEIPTP